MACGRIRENRSVPQRLPPHSVCARACATFVANGLRIPNYKRTHTNTHTCESLSCPSQAATCAKSLDKCRRHRRRTRTQMHTRKHCNDEMHATTLLQLSIWAKLKTCRKEIRACHLPSLPHKLGYFSNEISDLRIHDVVDNYRLDFGCPKPICRY